MAEQSDSDIANNTTVLGTSVVKTRPFWLCLVAIIIAELLVTLFQPLVGLVCHSAIFITLLVMSVYTNKAPSYNLIIALSLVPIIRIVSLSMPLLSVPKIYWFPAIYLPLLIATVVVMWMIGLTPRKVGFTARRLYLQIGFAIITGIPFGVAEFYILRPQPLVQEFSAGQIWLPALILLFTTGLVEELIFRGVLQQTTEPVMRRFWLVYTSIAFAILHIGHLSILDIVLVFIIASIFAFFVKRTGSLIGVTLSHGLTNIVLYLIAPFILS